MVWNWKIFLGILIFLFLIFVFIVLTGNYSWDNIMRSWYKVTESLGGVCEHISVVDQDHCFQYIARFSGNPLLCGKIEETGSRSKCRIFVAEWWKKGSWCNPLTRQPSGNGSYTYYDCIQYLAVKYKDPGLCDIIGQDISMAGNDLNEQGVSATKCIDLSSTSCGHIGQNTCISIESRFAPDGKLMREISYCLEGQNRGGRCVRID